MKKTAAIIILLVFALLTVLSQVGGVIFFLSLACVWPMKTNSFRKKAFLFSIIFGFTYILALTIIVPATAKKLGREPLPWTASDSSRIIPVNFLYPLLFRNYATHELKSLLIQKSMSFYANHGLNITYYDACLPFWDGFPLLPHLSHCDGAKVDLAFFYRDPATKKPLKTQPSPIGYWAYSGPKAGEARPCKNADGPLSWNFAWAQPLFSDHEFDPGPTRALIKELLASPKVQKILIEPHLKNRMGLSDARIRFQGCKAARHDDHLHLQIHR